MNSYLQLSNKHRGENAFIFGAGPSLWFNIRHKQFRKVIKQGITIAVNSDVIAIPPYVAFTEIGIKRIKIVPTRKIEKNVHINSIRFLFSLSLIICYSIPNF